MEYLHHMIMQVVKELLLFTLLHIKMTYSFYFVLFLGLNFHLQNKLSPTEITTKPNCQYKEQSVKRHA